MHTLWRPLRFTAFAGVGTSATRDLRSYAGSVGSSSSEHGTIGMGARVGLLPFGPVSALIEIEVHAIGALSTASFRPIASNCSRVLGASVFAVPSVGVEALVRVRPSAALPVSIGGGPMLRMEFNGPRDVTGSCVDASGQRFAVQAALPPGPLVFGFVSDAWLGLGPRETLKLGMRVGANTDVFDASWSSGAIWFDVQMLIGVALP